VPITLFSQQHGGWEKIGGGLTNADGRLPGLLVDEVTLPAGIYRMHFETNVYFNANKETGFYPYVDIVFELDAYGNHYHIPLLLTAFGYSTYRGS
jgi:5-hydroxyisourate hydrolase